MELPMTRSTARCLILACGNTLRGDDGVGPWLADWAENRFRAEADVRVLAPQQWTPELAEDIAHAESVLFVDASLASAPGSVSLSRLELRSGSRLELRLEVRGELRVGPVHAQGLATHHLGAPNCSRWPTNSSIPSPRSSAAHYRRGLHRIGRSLQRRRDCQLYPMLAAC